MDFSVVYIVGVGRSGTSLLQSMFATHPNVSYMPETSFIRRYLAKGVLDKACASSGREAVIQKLSDDEPLLRLGLDVSQIVAHAEMQSGLLDLEIYHQMLISRYEDNVEWVGDKDPRLIEFLPLISLLFPKAAVINIIRDPRDVLLSKKKASWSRTGHVWKHVFANRVQLKLGHNSGTRVLGNNYHEIVYENLIASPREVLSLLCKKIGLQFDETMLSFGDAAKGLVSQSEISWKKETFGPLLSQNKEKWKTELSSKEIVLTELCCKEAFRLGGNKTDDRKLRLTLLDKLWVIAGATLIFLADWPYRFYRNYTVRKACKRVR